MTRVITTILFGVCFSSASFAFTLSDFDSPDSFIADPQTGSYYVSNMAGDALAKDGNGYISKITPNGNILIQKYIGGKPSQSVLDAPKGILLSGKRIFVVDIDKVKVFDKDSGRLIQLIDLSAHGAANLTDIAMDSAENVYVSDVSTNRIYKMIPKNNYEASVFFDEGSLSEPSGLAVNPRTKSLMVVTQKAGKIIEIDAAGRSHTLKRGLPGLTGLDLDVEGNVYTASRETGEVYRIPYYGRGSLSTYLSGLAGPTDVAFDRKKLELLVPSSKNHTVTTYPKTKMVKTAPKIAPNLRVPPATAVSQRPK